MKFTFYTILAATSLAVTTTSAFTPTLTNKPSSVKVQLGSSRRRQSTFAMGRATAPAALMATQTDANDRDDEITRLQTMAAQLRAEAADLEAQQQSAVAMAAERAFDKFDVNKDGELSLDELKAGLEKTWKMELPDQRVQQLLAAFDASGDGVLQKNEMVKIEQFRNKLDALAREEKEQARVQTKQAQEEQQAYQQMQAAMEMINDGEPSTRDKIVSVLPYLFPLLDGLQFAGPWILQHPDNPVAQAAALAYGLYRSIPFGGFIAFFALSTLSGNLTINRLIRFNMQQAIFLDIALFAPALLAALVGFVGSAVGVTLPPALTEYTSEALFVTMLLSVTYASVTSLLGQTPNQIPLISQAVERRLPTFEFLDRQGRVLSREEREETRKKLDNNKDNNNNKETNDQDENNNNNDKQ